MNAILPGKSLKHLKFLVALFLVYTSAIGQTSTPNVSDYTKINEVLPPSPNAASLGKYGGLELSLASGTLSKNIPLYEYVSGKLKVPVSLSYFTSGFKVDELPGRVGNGWALNAGGVITRTVYGAADEYAQHLFTPPGFPARTTALIAFMEEASNSDETDSFDSQPDIFSFNFNGYSGKFILDSVLNPVLLAHSNLKIEKDFSAAASWNFKITTDDGIQYFFGGASAKELTKKTQAGTGCGKPFSIARPTAWYLTKIVHPNNESVTFSYIYIGTQYATSISESIYVRDLNSTKECINSGTPAPILPNTACEGILQTSGVLLSEINSDSGGSMKFTYIDRNDSDDKLLSDIKIYQSGQSSPFKTFSLNYTYSIATGFKNTYSYNDPKLTYRPFLLNLIEKSSDGSLSQKYSFSYNEIGALPPRLSYAQDDYGFFNGKNNTTLIPVPSTLTWKTKLPLATADRSLSAEFCSKGLLSAITYPTGGKDSIVYESNQVYKAVETYPATSDINVGAFNLEYRGGAGTTTYSTTAVVSFAQEAFLTGQCSSASTSGGDAIHDQSTITLLDENNNSVYSIGLIPGRYFNQVVNLTAGHSYRIKCNANGDNISGGASLSYMGGNIMTENKNVNTGGLRVAKIISSDPASTIPNIKRYYYGKLETPNISSGALVRPLQYEKYLTVYIPCQTAPDNDGKVLKTCDVNEYGFYSMYSNTLNNIYIYSSSPISYANVIESLGENYEGGGTEHKYTTEYDQSAYPLVGTSLMLGAPLTSYSWRNAREVYQYVFKVIGNSFIPVKKIFTNYKEDPRVDKDFRAYVANKKYSPYCNYDPPTDIEINAFDMCTYSVFQKWVYVDSVRTQEFDDKGISSMESLMVSEYGNPNHALITKNIASRSDSQSETSLYYYPQDITLSGDEESARQSLVTNHILNPVLKTQTYRGANLIRSGSVDYHIFPNGLSLPFNYKLSTGTAAQESRVNFYNYDIKGNLLCQSLTNWAKIVYLYSYNSQYPIGEIRNTDYATVVSALGGESAISSFSSSTPTDVQVNAFLAPLRTSSLLKDAQITTYTYAPLFGITSITDGKLMKTSYEYDTFQRLINVKDQNGYIIKNNDYHYRVN